MQQLKEELKKEVIELLKKGYTASDFDSILNLFAEKIRKATIEEIENNLPKVITPTVEPPPNVLSQNQIFAGGQVNMVMRVKELLTLLSEKLEKLKEKE